MKFRNTRPDGHKIIIVLDTETSDGFSNPSVYDLGYVIYDMTDGKILKERDYITSQIYDDPDRWATAYYCDKRPLYETRLADGYCKKCYWGTMCRILQNDIQDFQPDGIYAYNSRFDRNAITSTCEKLGSKINPTADGIIDIMDFIGVITETESYVNFCKDNGFMTKHRKPRPQKKAETLYRYLMGQTDFIEEPPWQTVVLNWLSYLMLLLMSSKSPDGRVFTKIIEYDTI